ncbi:MAG: DNA/RNA helicase domain-containing protein [Desulfatiglandales bacterium]
MRLYAGTSTQFITDTVHNQIAEKLKDAFFNQYRFNSSQGEIQSWRNSLRAMAQVLQYADLEDHGVLLEYQLPLTSLRLDCMITGRDQEKRDNAVMVELKQWEACGPAEGENEVLTWVGGAQREVLHPSAQVGRYSMYLQDNHTAFHEGEPVGLTACTYLHNYFLDHQDILLSGKFKSLLESFPLFSGDDVDRLANYLLGKLSKGEGLDVLKRIEDGKYRPSRKLMQHVANVIKGKSEYVLLDEQLVAYDSVFASARKGFHERRKSTIIIRGGPGTGKSVIAINLMADLLKQGFNAQYATGSRAFTETLRKAIGVRGAIQFKYFNSYVSAPYNAVDVLICDESHRIRKTSDNRFTRREERSKYPQVEELIKAAKVVVFLVDDRQIVRPGEIGSSEYIIEHAERLNCDIKDYDIKVQFRCMGSEAFVSWVNNSLGIERTPHILWNGEEGFDFRIFPSPHSLEAAIREKTTEGYSARLTAGFCWNWSRSPNADGTLKEDVVIGDYRRPWNARPESSRLAKGVPKATLWAYEPGGIEQIGCIYTAQGFEFDYVGVIFGNDLVYDYSKQDWSGLPGNSRDSEVRRGAGRFTDLVKNTYRVLLSRGMKGCYVYFMDRDTERFIRSRTENLPAQEPEKVIPSKVVDLRPYINSLPLFDLRAAANPRFSLIDGFLPDESNFGWVHLEGGPFPKDRFLVRIEGDSMEPGIPEGSMCLFKKDPGGSRNGKTVLCRIAEYGGSPVAVVKRYSSLRHPNGDSPGEAEKIVLSSLNPTHQDIVLTEGDDIQILGIFERVIAR